MIISRAKLIKFTGGGENNIKKNTITTKNSTPQYILPVERPKMMRYRQKVDTLAAGITNRSQPAALSDDACLYS